MKPLANNEIIINKIIDNRWNLKAISAILEGKCELINSEHLREQKCGWASDATSPEFGIIE